MNPLSLEKLKKLLVLEKNQISEELEKISGDKGRGLATDSGVLGKYDTDATQDERARFVSESADEVAVERILESRLNLIESTIDKINKGAYGICGKCRANIEPRRLEAMPCALFCANCMKGGKK